ncbi:MAG TPA: hypothetical protein VGD60_10525 [Candidatus Acidoferrales bacterium]
MTEIASTEIQVPDLPTPQRARADAPESAAVKPKTAQDCAVSVVRELLSTCGLARMIEPESLEVLVGDGNWISFSFQIQRGADHNSIELVKVLRRTSGKASQSNARKSAWFRSTGMPSLHFQVIPAERLGEIYVRGHVDAADPLGHPVAHLVRDYLPAHGIGTHPTPDQILAMLPARRA